MLNTVSVQKIKYRPSMMGTHHIRVRHILRLILTFLYVCPSLANAQFKSNERVISAALSLHFELPELGLTYEDCVQYIKGLGATHISINIQVSMTDIQSSTLSLIDQESTQLEDVERVLAVAQELDLKVIFFPMIWVKNRQDGEWRGTLIPQDQDRWWAAYESWISDLAVLAQVHGVDYLSIGSELSSLEKEKERWQSLIRKIRSIYKGKITYSANWDHFTEVPFWDQLDVIGLTAYYPLTDRPKARLNMLIERWKMIRVSLNDWLSNHFPKHRILFTELGYPSQVGGAAKPWHYLQTMEVDLLIQKKAFKAFREVWHNAPELLGVNIWNLWGLGGPHDTWYTVRGKPAAQEVKQLFRQLRTGLTSQSLSNHAQVDK